MAGILKFPCRMDRSFLRSFLLEFALRFQILTIKVQAEFKNSSDLIFFYSVYIYHDLDQTNCKRLS